MRRRALLLGGTGQLGTELRRQGESDWDIVAPTRRELDLTNIHDAAEMVQAVKPSLIINCSAYHVVDLCESHFTEALALNAIAVHALAREAERVKALFVTFSTDYAFDGTSSRPYREVDAANPIQAYGISKVAGEHAALAANPERSLVVRTCGLYGHAPSRQKAGNFITNRIADARGRTSIDVGCDLKCTPTSAHDLARGVLALLEFQSPPGLYHLTNTGECDWATFTMEIYRLADIGVHVVPTDRHGRYFPARRPQYSVLDVSKARGMGVEMRPWNEALAEFIKASILP